MKKIICLIMIAISIAFPFRYVNTVYAENEDFLTEETKSYILVDYNTGSILCEKNSNERYEIASMVKLMTSLLTMEELEKGNCTLDTKFTVSEYAASMEGSEAFLEPNKEYTINDLLKSVIVASANDSSVVLAENIAGSEQAFVKRMNDKARSLGMENTLYANATGLPSTLQYSTAKDVSTLLREIVNHKIYYNYSNIWMDNLVHYDGRITELVNTNRLIRQYKGCDIGKTGFTDEAGYCLASSVKRNDMRLISVVMGAKTTKERFSASEKIFNYGFNNYVNEKIIDSSQEIENDIELCKGKDENIKIRFERDFYYICKKGENSEVKVVMNLPKRVKAPIKSGEKISTAYLTKDGVIIDEINIISNEDYEKYSYKDAIDTIIDNWSF